jgi:hypothetical protein
MDKTAALAPAEQSWMSEHGPSQLEGENIMSMQ